MTQLVLSPDDNSTTGSFPQSTRFPDRIRKFGRFIDTQVLEPGDVMLFADARPTVLGNLIVSTQKKLQFSQDDSRWTHVAIYAGEEHICEAVVQGGIRYHPLHDYIGARLIRVRRDNSLAVDQRYRIVIRAMTQLRQQYGYLSALKIWRAAFASAGFFSRSIVPLIYPRNLVCSQLFADAYGAVTQKMLDSSFAFFTPAHVSATTKLIDVQLHWWRVPP
ncbi:MAG: YiiX/YebB-like N1pC/P60 family cysteine hydrolase [Rhodospirillaceae bacterium]|nr:YiiX/YebB-like N1pC/P60 family cysteine hydrolase [Rhodospirillaceae bacterium]